jgi:hypothetical protein
MGTMIFEDRFSVGMLIRFTIVPWAYITMILVPEFPKALLTLRRD